MIDEYTFSSKEILRQKVGRMIQTNKQAIVGFQGRFPHFKAATDHRKGGGVRK